MRKIMKVAAVLMTILTMIYISAVVYANSTSGADSNVNGKRPVEYGILRAYFGEKMETEPQEWNTTEELGIIFAYKVSDEPETYATRIVDPEKALPWMNSTPMTNAPTPYVKYEGKFYRIVWIFVDPAEPVWRKWEIPTGTALVVGWFCTGVLFFKGRKRQAPSEKQKENEGGMI